LDHSKKEEEMIPMLDCPVCPRTQIAEDCCPQCGTDLKPLLRLAKLRVEAQTPPPRDRKHPFPTIALGIALFLAGLAVFPAWRLLYPPVPEIVLVKLPPPAPPLQPQHTMYTVRKGDSFWSIAREKYGMGEMMHRIRDDNKDRLRKPGRLGVGEQIRLRAVTISPQ
jgi:LysM domain